MFSSTPGLNAAAESSQLPRPGNSSVHRLKRPRSLRFHLVEHGVDAVAERRLAALVSIPIAAVVLFRARRWHLQQFREAQAADRIRLRRIGGDGDAERAVETAP